MSILEGAKRVIRTINLKDTVGFHKYKLKDGGEKYWDERIANAKDAEELAYCAAQKEKSKINKARKKEAINNNPKIIELRRQREELLNKLKEIYKNPKLTIEQKKAFQDKLRNAISAIDTMIKNIENEIIANLHSEYESAIGLFEDSNIEKEPKLGNAFGNISWKDIKNGKTPSKPSEEKESPEESTKTTGTTSKNPITGNAPSAPYTKPGQNKDDISIDIDTKKDKKDIKSMSQEELDKIISDALNIDDEITQITETEEEKLERLERERIEKIEEIKRKIVGKEEELRKKEDEIKKIKKVFGKPMQSVEEYENTEDLKLIIQKQQRLKRHVDIYIRKINEIADNGEELIDGFKKSGRKLTLIKALTEAENKKDNVAIDKAKEDLAKLLGKDKKDINDPKKEREDALRGLEELKDKVGIKFDAKGNAVYLTEDDKKEMKINDFIELITDIQDGKEDILEELNEDRVKIDKKITDIKELIKEDEIPSKEEYETLKQKLIPVVDGINILEEDKIGIQNEIEELNRNLSELEPEVETDVEEDKLSKLTEMIDKAGLTDEEIASALNVLSETLNRDEEDINKDTEEIGE